MLEGQMMPDHVHMLISIAPKYSVSQVGVYIKGKSAIQIARCCMGRGKNHTGMSFFVREYFVSTVGKDEKVIREYIQNQEKADRVADQFQPKLI